MPKKLNQKFTLMLPLLYLFQIEKNEGKVSFDPILFHHFLKGLQFYDYKNLQVRKD
jgi:hypothetical protein